MHSHRGNSMPGFMFRSSFRQKLLFVALACCTAVVSAGGNDTFYTSFETGEPAPLARPSGAAFSIAISGGPSPDDAFTAKPGVGFTGLHSLRYEGHAGGRQEAAMFDVDLPVQANTQLSYLLFPCIT